MTQKIEFTENDSTIVAEKAVFQGFFQVIEYQLRHRLFQGGWSETMTRELFHRGNSSAVLLYDQKRHCVVLVEQFRVGAFGHPISPWLLELVAGMNHQEQPAEVVCREALEEANCSIQQLIPICDYLVSPGGTNERVYLFCGLIDSEGLGGVHGLPDEHEDIRVHVVPVAEAIRLMQQGAIDNAATIIALQWLQLREQPIFQAER